MDVSEEWSVPNSDDERDEALLNLPKNGYQDLPLKILKYYADIENNQVLELEVKEFRTCIPQDNVDVDKYDCQKEVESEGEDHEENQVGQDKEDKALPKPNEPSAFDYLEEPEEHLGQIPRRPPKTGRLPKKRIGTLQNVISDLKRYKELDSSTSEEAKLTTEEGKKELNEHKDDKVDTETT